MNKSYPGIKSNLPPLCVLLVCSLALFFWKVALFFSSYYCLGPKYLHTAPWNNDAIKTKEKCGVCSQIVKNANLWDWQKGYSSLCVNVPKHLLELVYRFLQCCLALPHILCSVSTMHAKWQALAPNFWRIAAWKAIVHVSLALQSTYVGTACTFPARQLLGALMWSETFRGEPKHSFVHALGPSSLRSVWMAIECGTFLFFCHALR